MNSDFDSDRLVKEVQQKAVQIIATNYLNKKRDFPPLPLVDMDVSYSPIPTSKKAKLPSSTITKKKHCSYNFCNFYNFQHQDLMLIEVSSYSLMEQMVSLFHKFSCHSLHFRVQYLMLEVSSHQLLVLIVPPTPKINYQVHQLHMSIHSDQPVCHYQMNQLQLVLT